MVATYDLPALAITRVADGVASLRISTDANPYLNAGYVQPLAAAVERLKADTGVRVILVEGGTRYFSAGASRDALLENKPGVDIESYVFRLPPLILALPVPTIAVMSGHAIGGGLALGLWCDLAVMAEESLYGANFMALGFTPGMGSTVVVEEAFGAPLARELLFTGRLLKGREIRAAGGPMSHSILPRAEVRPHAMELAEEIAKAPRESLVLLKETFARRRGRLLEQAAREEREMHHVLFDSGTGIRAGIGERYFAAIGADAAGGDNA